MPPLEEENADRIRAAANEKPRIPHTFVILFGVVVLIAILSYFLPAGEYERQTDGAGQEVVVNGTYHHVEPRPAGLLDIFQSIFRGLEESADVIFLLLIVGGAFGVLKNTGVIEQVFDKILVRFQGREIYIIPLLTAFFAICGATFGMAEESIPYLIILMPFLLKMGFNRILAIATPLLGTTIGWAGSITNPFNVGVAQKIADLPLFSGLGIRMGLLAILIVVTSTYLIWYARKTLPVSRETAPAFDETELARIKAQKFSLRGVLVLLVFAATIFVVPYGIIRYDWYMGEMSALFLIMGIVIGIIAGMNYNDIADAFTNGCKDLLVAALSVGLAYSAVVLLEQTHSMDTIIYLMTRGVADLPTYFGAIGMLGAQSAINYVISSGSGQAALTMPLMTPLADMIDVSRQTAVLAFQYGDGISNALTPTNGYLMAGLAIGGVSWFKWARFLIPLLLVQYVIGAVYILLVHLYIWS